MIQYSDQERTGEHFVLNSKTELYYLGHALTLRKCSIEIAVPARALVVARTTFIDCDIATQRVLKGFRWDSAHLKGCRFKGHFTGNDFGNTPAFPDRGSVEGCDFTQARLDACRFVGCDTQTIQFPRWPCFTILDPYRRHRELGALPWPGDLGPIVMQGFGEDFPTTVAVTYLATDLSKRHGTTPEAIRAVLETLDGVRY